MELTRSQQLALDIDHHVAVEAGAGSGKTTVLARRFLCILTRFPALTPRHILTITFTRKAAGELADRIDSELSRQPVYTIDDQIGLKRWRDDLRWAQIGTIHSFCALILRRWGYTIGVDAEFRLIDDWEKRQLWEASVADEIARMIDDNNSVIAALLGDMPLSTINTMLDELFRSSRLRNGSPPPTDDSLTANTYHLFYRCLDRYRRRGMDVQRLDFDELQRLAVQLVRDYSDIRHTLSTEYPFIMVDEFQDTDPLQWELIDLISGYSTGNASSNLYVVGDIKQSIYRFRGSDSDLFQRLLNDFDRRADSTLIQLSDNFRSTPRLIHFYNALFSELFIKGQEQKIQYSPLSPGKSDHDVSTIECRLADSLLAEHATITQWITATHSAGIPWNDIAIIARTTASLTQVIPALEAHGIPYSYGVIQHPLRSNWALALISLIRWIHGENPVTTYEVNQWDWTPFGHDFTLPAFQTIVAKKGIVAALHQHISMIDSPDLLDAWAIIGSILNRFKPISEAIAIINRELTESCNGTPINQAEGVRLMTIHKSKGLEFDSVAVIACGKSLGIRPPSSLLVSPDGRLGFSSISTHHDSYRKDLFNYSKRLNIDEERRIFYVGCTRAKRRLLLSGTVDGGDVESSDPKTYLDFLLGDAVISDNSITLHSPDGDSIIDII